MVWCRGVWLLWDSANSAQPEILVKMQSELMSPSKTPCKVDGKNEIEQNTLSFQAKIDQRLGFHGLVQPGAACSSQEQPGATLSQDRCLLLRQDGCLISSHLSCLNSRHLSWLNRRHPSCLKRRHNSSRLEPGSCRVFC